MCVLITRFGLAHKWEFVVRDDDKDFKHQNIEFRRGPISQFSYILLNVDKQSLRTAVTSRARMSTRSNLLRKRVFFVPQLPVQANAVIVSPSKPQPLLSTLLYFITYVNWLLAYREFI